MREQLAQGCYLAVERPLAVYHRESDALTITPVQQANLLSHMIKSSKIEATILFD